MNLTEFLAKNLKIRQMVTLVVKNADGKHENVECFFAGYRTPAGKKILTDPDEEIVPLFRGKNKRGGMSRKDIAQQPASLKDIEAVYPMDDEGKFAQKEYPGADALRSLCNVAETTADACMENAIGLVRDMAKIFPGRKIFFDTDGAPWATKPEKYGADNGYVRAVWFEGKKMRFRFSGAVDEIITDDLHIDSWDDFLMCLMDAIETPFLDEDRSDTDESFAWNLSWEDIPNPNPGECPNLAASGLLVNLMLELWFEQEGKEFVFEDEWYGMTRAEKLRTYLRFVK